MTHAENFFSQNCNIFAVLSIFECNPGETNNEFITIHVMSYRHEFKRKRNRRIPVYGSVARYGPRTSCQRKWLKTILFY